MRKHIYSSLLVLAVGGLISVGSASAQTATPAPGAGPGVVDPGHPRVNQVNRREERQQDRIANGIKDGQLTPGEASRLEKGESRIQNQEKRDMKAHNGHLTKAEQNKLNREENHESRHIYHAKHNERAVEAFQQKAANSRGFLFCLQRVVALQMSLRGIFHEVGPAQKKN
jgi:hypothetical protein